MPIDIIGICSHCNDAMATLKTCTTRCREARYCSQECQQQDWKKHKPRCNQMFQAAKAQIDQNNQNYLQQMKERKNEEHPLNTSRSAMAHQTAFGMYVPEILLLDGVPPPNFTLFLDATFDLHSDSTVDTTFGKEL